MTPLLAITGAAGAGKDAVARCLRAQGWVSIAFADPPKQIVRDTWNLPEVVLWGPSELRALPILACPCGWTGVEGVPGIEDGPCCSTPDRKPIMVPNHGGEVPLTSRRALQRLGTEWGRALDLAVWVRRGVQRARFLAGAIHPGVGSGPLGAHRDAEGTYWPALSACVEHARCLSCQVPITMPPFCEDCTREDAGRFHTPEEIQVAEAAWSPGRVQGVVLVDCRFPNEAEAIRAAGGRIWRVARPPAEYVGPTVPPTVSAGWAESLALGDADRCDKGGWGSDKPHRKVWCWLRNGHGGACQGATERSPQWAAYRWAKGHLNPEIPPYDSWRSHASETEGVSIQADVILRNDGTLADLREKVVSALAVTQAQGAWSDWEPRDIAHEVQE